MQVKFYVCEQHVMKSQEMAFYPSIYSNDRTTRHEIGGITVAAMQHY